MSAILELERLLAAGKLTRRDFMTRISALGVASFAMPALTSGPARADVPRKGGRLRLGLAGGSTTDSLDPATITDAMVQNINWQLRNCLVETNAEGELIPELAETWESTPDAATWIFYLRRGVEFHNGKTMVAEDVIDSFNHHRGEASKSAAKGIVDPILDVHADGKYRVVFDLREGNADFPYITSDYHLTIAPAGTRGQDWEKGVGTGGYALARFEPGFRALTTRFANYWKNGRAHFDEVETLGIADVTARVTALNTDQIDAMNRFELKLIHLLKRAPGIQIINVTGNKHYSVPMLTDREPFDDNDVRLALKYAVDRKHLVDVILRGFGTVGNDHPIAPNQKYYAADLPQRQYDPDRARYHMKKAGMLDYPFEIHAADAAFVGAVDAALLFKEHAAKAGITIDVVREPNDGYWNNVWMKKPWSMCYWSGRPTADWMFSTAYAADAAWNDTFWKHGRFNRLLKEARSELDEARRAEMYRECQKIVRDEGGVVIPVFGNWIDATNGRIGFQNPSGNWEMDGLRCAERWWFRS